MANKYELRRRALKDSTNYGSTRGGAKGGQSPSWGHTPPVPMDRRGLTVALCLGLVVLVSALYVQTARHEFTVCDDNVYIYEKPQIRTGLTWESAKWAFQDAHEGNWHPLTWISHMLDWQVFSHGTWEPENRIYKDSWAGGHHLVSMFLHCINAVLLFLALRVMTRTLWPSFVVAVLFAAHPLRVESVAWAAERKDVLCGLFWMASMLVYALYARRPRLLQSSSNETLGTLVLYLLLCVFMALGLMAKSMIVTLPCVLILLDIWPLDRWKRALWPEGPGGELDLFGGLWLLLEKVPLFGLAAGDCYVTVYGQAKGVALNSFEGLPLGVRVLNAVESCGEYLRQTVWPTGLMPFYAHPHMIPHGWTREFYVKFWIYGLLILLITALAGAFFRRRPYLAVGWLWYLGALIPVIGIIQVGTQARADRYTYLPMIGVYLMVAWLLKDLADRWPRVRPFLAAGGMVVLAAMSVATFQQVSYWINSYKLFKHSIGVTEKQYFGYDASGAVDLEKAKSVAKTETNYFAFNHIGIAYDKDGKEFARTDPNAAQQAFDHSAAAFAASLGIKPDYDFGNNNLGVYFARPGKSHNARAAETFFRGAIVVNPRYADAFNNLGIVLAEQGRDLLKEGKLEEALAKFEDSARQHGNGLGVRNDRASDHNNLCGVYLQISLAHKAMKERAEQAHDADRASSEADLQSQFLKRAMNEDEVALLCDPNFVGAWMTRLDILREQNKLDDMVPCWERIIEIDPRAQEAVQALNGLVTRYVEQKNPEKALACLEKTGARFVQAAAGKPPSLELIRMPFALALIYLNLKQPDKAIAWLDQIVAIDRSLPQVFDVRGTAYATKGDLVHAKADFEQVYTLAPQFPNIQEKLRAVNAMGRPH